MASYIIRRLLLIVPTLFVVTVVVFGIMRLVPGSIVDIMVEQQPSSQYALSREDIQHALGLDVPIHIQYWRWVGGIILRGDFGESLWTGDSVVGDMLRKFPVSFELCVLALIVSQLIALPVGVYSAVRQDTLGDYLARCVAIACIALPSFWLATLVMVFPAIWWRWSPSFEYFPFFNNPIGNLGVFIIPAVILGMVVSGTTMRMTRTMMLEVLRQDYVRTAWAKGLSERVIVFRHALKNAMMPVVTIIGIQLAALIGGSIILEDIFVLPGIGRMLVQSINQRDYPVISGINLFIATLVLFINLGVDLTYAYLDPRVHYK